MKRSLVFILGMSFYFALPAGHPFVPAEHIRLDLQHLWGVLLANRLQFAHIPWQGIEVQPEQRRRHTRRGDNKQRAFTQQQHKNNNSFGGQKHAQNNMRVHQPQAKNRR